MEKGDKEVVFSTMDEEGKVTTIKIIQTADIMRCPKAILVPEHYRDDGSCRCNTPICDVEECRERKYREEIYCRYHLERMFGDAYLEDYDDEC